MEVLGVGIVGRWPPFGQRLPCKWCHTMMVLASPFWPCSASVVNISVLGSCLYGEDFPVWKDGGRRGDAERLACGAPPPLHPLPCLMAVSTRYVPILNGVMPLIQLGSACPLSTSINGQRRGKKNLGKENMQQSCPDSPDPKAHKQLWGFGPQRTHCPCCPF